MKIDCNVRNFQGLNHLGYFDGNDDLNDFMKAYIKLQVKGTTDIRILLQNLLSMTALFDSMPESTQNFFNMSNEEKIQAQQNFLLLLQKWNVMP